MGFYHRQSAPFRKDSQCSLNRDRRWSLIELENWSEVSILFYHCRCVFISRKRNLKHARYQIVLPAFWSSQIIEVPSFQAGSSRKSKDPRFLGFVRFWVSRWVHSDFSELIQNKTVTVCSDASYKLVGENKKLLVKNRARSESISSRRSGFRLSGSSQDSSLVRLLDKVARISAFFSFSTCGLSARPIS